MKLKKLLNQAQYKLYTLRHPDAPWLVPDAVDMLEEFLGPESHVFEWGSGRSTLWMAKRAKKVLSVEHNYEWYKITQDGLPKNSKVEYQPSPKSNKQYADSILAYGKVFDVILVDGRQRIACLKNSVTCIKQGGLIVLDNSERFGSYVQDSFVFFDESLNNIYKNSLAVCLSNGLWETTVFKF